MKGWQEEGGGGGQASCVRHTLVKSKLYCQCLLWCELVTSYSDAQCNISASHWHLLNYKTLMYVTVSWFKPLDADISIQESAFHPGTFEMGSMVKKWFIWEYSSFTRKNIDSIKVKGSLITRDYWIFGLSPSPGIVKNTAFRKLDVFPSSRGEGRDTYSVGSVMNN
jgi:hypothetical protein